MEARYLVGRIKFGCGREEGGEQLSREDGWMPHCTMRRYVNNNVHQFYLFLCFHLYELIIVILFIEVIR